MFLHKRPATLLGLISLVFFAVMPVGAIAKEVSDPQDMSAGTPLDIASVTVTRHRRSHEIGVGPTRRQHLLRFSIETYQPFDDAALEDIDGEFPALSLHFDLDHDGKFERMLFVQAIPDATGHAVKAEMTKGNPIHKYQIGKRLVGYAEVWRETTSSVTVEFRDSLAGIRAGHHFWWAARAISESEPGVVGVDYAPEAPGTVRGKG